MSVPVEFYRKCSHKYCSGHVTLSQDGKLSLVDNLCTGFDLYNTTDVVPKQCFEIPGKQNHVKDGTFIEGDSAVACPSEPGFVYIFQTDTSKPHERLRHGHGLSPFIQSSLRCVINRSLASWHP